MEKFQKKKKVNTKVKQIAWMRSVCCSDKLENHNRSMCMTLPAVDISLVVFGIQGHIHHMGIALLEVALRWK